jgi:hypothetical protein
MESIDIDTILTIIYVIVDDWYQNNGKKTRLGKPGCQPTFTDSEVMTLMLAGEYVPYPGELQFIAYIRANHHAMFPKLLTQSQFNRRARNLRHLVEEMRRDWLHIFDTTSEEYYLLDTKPIPVVGYKRSKKHSDFAGSAAYGYCASREFYYFGYKLVMITTMSGIPVVYDLVPANTDERKAAETVLMNLKNATIIADKGFIGIEWQSQIQKQTGNRLLTPMRKNQKIQHSVGFELLLNTVRERIEGVFHEIQNTGRHIERLLAKTVTGLITRVAVKVTAHLLKLLLRSQYGIDVQTFQKLPGFDF